MRVLLVLAAALAITPTAGAYTRFPLFEEAAGQIAGRPVEVRCAHADEWAADPHAAGANAYTWFTSDGPSHVVLSPRTCFVLLLLAVQPGGGTAWDMNPWVGYEESGVALRTLGHEATHMTGVRDERVAECRGLDAVPAAARTFGAPPDRMLSFARVGRPGAC